uniref:Seminal fluid protein n=1 Tax=Nilaparvata lugens TaxID=108931 RepID=A0A1I9WL24_NILLU|nr:seminal fluid protein [Nilaparvata lugens]
MWNQHHSCFVWWCLVMIVLSQAFVECSYTRKRKPVRERTLEEEEEFKAVVNAVSTYVHAPTAKYLGKIYRGENDEYYQSFANVPYAKPPLDWLRWEKPAQLDNSDEYYDATNTIEYEEINKRCKQYVRWDGHANNAEDMIVGYEDCLYLDIIRPVDLEIEHKHRLEQDIIGANTYADVLVFLHPGTFMYDIPMNHYQMTEYFCCNYMLFVFVRFRLGILGFPNFGQFGYKVVPNVGLWDQVAALKWIQRNIAAFGGDVDRVTLAGVAAGGASVNYHIISEASKGLFQKAISVGGSALCPWAYASQSVNNTLKVALSVKEDCPKEEAEACFLTADIDDIVKKSAGLYVFQNLPLSPLGPAVDDDFLIAEPNVLMRAHHAQPIPWLVSVSTDYSLYPNFDFISKIDTEYQHENYFRLAPQILGLVDRLDDEIMNEVLWQIREHYTKKVFNGNESAEVFSQMVSDRMYTTGIVEAARLHGLTLRKLQTDEARMSIWKKFNLPGNYHFTDDYFEKQVKAIYDKKVYMYKYNYKFNRVVDFLVSPVTRWANLHREEFALLTRDELQSADDTPDEEDQKIEVQMRKSITSLWASFIDEGICYERYNRTTYYYPDIFDNYTTRDSLSICFTEVQGPNVYLGHFYAFDLGQAHYWRDLPIQDFEEFDDFETFDEDDGDVWRPI